MFRAGAGRWSGGGAAGCVEKIGNVSVSRDYHILIRKMPK